MHKAYIFFAFSGFKMKSFCLSFLVLIAGVFSKADALKLDRAILSTNNNPLYVEFWPIVAPIWNAMGIKPTLALIGDENCEVDESLGDVIRFPTIPGVSDVLQTQAIRLLLPCLFPDDGCLISDIDMIPLSKEYLVDGASHCEEGSILIYRDACYDRATYTYYPMCYVAAKGSVFGAVFEVTNSDDISKKLEYWDSLSLGWTTDEILLYLYVQRWEKEGGSVSKLGDGYLPRLDRMDWPTSWHAIDFSKYIDCHCPRPYSKYKCSIDQIARWAISRYQDPVRTAE